jgi:hypothetical protein
MCVVVSRDLRIEVERASRIWGRRPKKKIPRVASRHIVFNR